jgi:Ca-activated chloride channel homolog
MQVTTKLDYRVVPRGEAVTVRLLVRLTPEPRSEAVRPPLSVGLVLDRSGSMTGEKLWCVKEASRQLINTLSAGDTLSITTFDDIPASLLPPVAVGRGRNAMISAIDAIQPGGSTDLCGGYKLGGASLQRSISNMGLCRILLLTDGLANCGTTEPVLIANVVERFASQGIGTSTIGVGSGYNEELLGMMAGRGGGTTYFLRNPAEAADVFAEELGDLSSVDARDIAVEFVPAVPALAVDQLNTYATDGTYRWRMGNLFGSTPRCLVLEIHAPPFGADAGTHVLLGHVRVTCKRWSGDGFEPFSSLVPVSLRLGAREDMAAVEPDRDVTLQAAYLMAARAVLQALDLADLGQFGEAAVRLETTANRLEKLGLDDEILRETLLDLRERALRLREDQFDYYNPDERKQMFTESTYIGVCVSEKAVLMRERAARHGSRNRPGTRYPGSPHR